LRHSIRLALLGAFRFPAPLGSQRFLAEQARALAEAGAEVEHCTYGEASRTERGIDLAKLGADRALAARLAAAHRARPFDAVLAHNAEAALLALAVRARGGPPVVYVAHTLWAEEAETWLPPALAPAARPAGAWLDRRIARAADAALVLTEPARAALAPLASGPVALLPPAHRAEPAPSCGEVAAACARHGLRPDGYALYTGNLDAYQDLAALDRARAVLPLVVATHDARRVRLRNARVVRSDRVEELRLLTFGAGVALLPRARSGGFPMKVLQYMEAGRAIVLRRALAGALVHGESAWAVADAAAPADFAAALDALAADDALRARLGAGARRVLAAQHGWPARAAETLALVRAAIERGGARR
jgi:glycosyltransferase involved in cell wall biosynthesis